jgi:hypothetical protein
MSLKKEQRWFVELAFYFFGWIGFHYLEHALGVYFGWRFFLDPNFSFSDTLLGAILFSLLMLVCSNFFVKRRKELE